MNAKPPTAGPGGIITKYLTFFAILFGLVCAEDYLNLEDVGIVHADPSFGKGVYNCTREIEINYAVFSALERENATELIDVFHSVSYEKTSSNVTLEESIDEVTLDKRCHPTGHVIHWKEWRTTGSGTWWGTWEPVSCCDWCNLGPTLCTRSRSYSKTYTLRISVGISFGRIAATTNLELTQTHQWSSTFSCTWRGGDGPSQIWAQQQYYWSDMQSRDMVVGENNCRITGQWSGNKRSDVPIKNAVSHGCSIGRANTECDKPNCRY